MTIGNYHCQRNRRFHNVSIARTCQVEFHVMGIRRCILHDSFDDHASFWILSAIISYCPKLNGTVEVTLRTLTRRCAVSGFRHSEQEQLSLSTVSFVYHHERNWNLTSASDQG